MAKCKNCKNLVYQVENGHRFPWCPIYDDCYDVEVDRDCTEYQLMSHGDLIRRTSDEDLAEARVDMMYNRNLDMYYCSDGSVFGEYFLGDRREAAVQHELAWLRSTVDE